jgi:Pregnancy-associated plasma protein-A
MKSLFTFFLVFAISLAKAQTPFCGTVLTKPPHIFTKKQIDSLNSITTINVPYAIKLWFTVFADNDGSNQATIEPDIKLKVQQMKVHFQASNICFILAGITYVNNTDLNNHDVYTEGSELLPYMQTGFMNVFVHKTLPGLFGFAYGIPSNYLSLVDAVLNPLSGHSIFAHEMGHSLGLLHTFETGYGSENVARNGGCKNCTSAGDLLCDTPADNQGPHDANCVYTGTSIDACGVAYAPNTNNIMSYFNDCSNVFTPEQSSRMHNHILGVPLINALVAQDTQNFPSTANATIYNASGTQTFVARDFVGISQFSNNLFETTGSAKQVIIGRTVNLKAGTRIHPTTGRVHLKANPYCQ